MKFMQKLRKSAKEKKGFTLIELIIVIAIIAILIALIAPQLVKFLGTARETSVDANAKTAYASIQAYLTEMEVKKTPIDATKIQINETEAKVTEGTTTNFVSDDLMAYFTKEELKGCTVIAVIEKAGTGSVLKSVTWDNGSGTDNAGVYPAGEQAQTPETDAP